ncbi:MAG TPA: HdeD family acid-resistance protein [Chthoniobacteraceae bacterium]|nr:HdeD family acid-resistance protein [Chthoniobacteraceae bacterium]
MTDMTLPGLHELRANWGWVLALGIALLVLGLLAITTSVVATLTTIVFLGCLLLIAGGFEIANAFRHGQYGGFWMHLLTGALDLFCGAILVAFPMAGAAALTFVLALFFLVGGTVRAATAVVMKLPNGVWAIVSGVIDFILGILLIASWPVSSLWFLGLLVGFGLAFRGFWWIAFAFAVRATEDHGAQGHAPSRA